MRDELIRNADAAMYIAKRDGKGSYRMFEPTMHSDVLARLELRGDLQRRSGQRRVGALLPAGDASQRRHGQRHGGAGALARIPSAG